MHTETKPAFPLRRALVAVFFLHVVAISGVVFYGLIHRQQQPVAKPPLARHGNRRPSGGGTDAESAPSRVAVAAPTAATAPARTKSAQKPPVVADERTRAESIPKGQRKAARPQDFALQLIQGESLPENKPAPKKR